MPAVSFLLQHDVMRPSLTLFLVFAVPRYGHRRFSAPTRLETSTPPPPLPCSTREMGGLYEGLLTHHTFFGTKRGSFSFVATRGYLPLCVLFCDSGEGLFPLSFSFRRDEGLLPFVRIFFYFHDEEVVASSYAFSFFSTAQGALPFVFIFSFSTRHGASASSYAVFSTR